MRGHDESLVTVRERNRRIKTYTSLKHREFVISVLHKILIVWVTKSRR
jgi:hypothetical protein